MGTVTILVDNPQEQDMAKQTQHMAEEVQEIYGYSSPLEALMYGVRMQLAARKKQDESIEKMKRLHAELAELQGIDYRSLSDEEIKEICDEISGGF